MFTEFVTILFLLFTFGFFGHEIWGILAPHIRDWTCTSSAGRWSLNNWTTREVPHLLLLAFHSPFFPVLTLASVLGDVNLIPHFYDHLSSNELRLCFTPEPKFGHTPILCLSHYSSFDCYDPISFQFSHSDPHYICFSAKPLFSLPVIVPLLPASH